MKNFANQKKSRIFAVPFGKCVFRKRDLRRKSEGLFIGVWRSWLAHLVWDQRVLCSSHSTPTEFEERHGFMPLFFIFPPFLRLKFPIVAGIV